MMSEKDFDSSETQMFDPSRLNVPFHKVLNSFRFTASKTITTTKQGYVIKQKGTL